VSYSEEYLARDQANAFATDYKHGRFNALIARFCDDVRMYEDELRKLYPWHAKASCPVETSRGETA
jgi:hypothetical protein